MFKGKGIQGVPAGSGHCAGHLTETVDPGPHHYGEVRTIVPTATALVVTWLQETR